MYKKAFQSQNWKALHSNLPARHDKVKKLSKHKLAEARKFNQYLKAVRSRLRHPARADKHKSQKHTLIPKMIQNDGGIKAWMASMGFAIRPKPR